MLKNIFKKIKYKIKSRLKPKPSVETVRTRVQEDIEIKDEPFVEEEKYPDLEITREQLVLMYEAEKPLLIDIREPYEIRQGHLKDSILLPMRFIPQAVANFPQDVDLVICCAAGIRSYDVAYYLREQGLLRAWSLEGGVASWADKGYVFPSSSGSIQLLQEIKTERGTALVCEVTENPTTFRVHFVDEGFVVEEFESLDQLNAQN